MGRNFRLACHRCKVKAFLFRGGERAMHMFYKKHDECMASFPASVVCKDDQMQEECWMRDDGDYDTDTETEHESRRGS